jgi:hypothetical protein
VRGVLPGALACVAWRSRLLTSFWVLFARQVSLDGFPQILGCAADHGRARMCAPASRGVGRAFVGAGHRPDFVRRELGEQFRLWESHKFGPEIKAATHRGNGTYEFRLGPLLCSPSGTGYPTPTSTPSRLAAPERSTPGGGRGSCRC